MDSSEGQPNADLKIHADTNPFPGLIVAAYNLAASDREKAIALRSQAFESAQWIGDEQTAKAIAAMSARIVAGGGDLSPPVRERQALSRQAPALAQMPIARISQLSATPT